MLEGHTPVLIPNFLAAFSKPSAPTMARGATACRIDDTIDRRRISERQASNAAFSFEFILSTLI
jgi:hypothetical protein